jgi:hypothetical protein
VVWHEHIRCEVESSISYPFPQNPYDAGGHFGFR